MLDRNFGALAVRRFVGYAYGKLGRQLVIVEREFKTFERYALGVAAEREHAHRAYGACGRRELAVGNSRRDAVLVYQITVRAESVEIRQHAEIGDGVVEPSARAAVDNERVVAAPQARFDGGEHVRVVLVAFQLDDERLGVLGRRARIEIADK